MADIDKWSIEKLDSSNWMTWKFQIKHLLLAKDLWGFIDGTEVLQDDASAQQRADFNKRSQKAFSTMVMSVSSSQLYLITSYEEPRRAWTALKNHFERDTLVNKLILKKQYFRMEMAEGTSMEAHIKTMKELTDRLAAINAPIAEEDQVVTLLGSLPPSYSALVTALEARDAVTLSYVQQSLIREEQRLKESNTQHTGLNNMSGIGRALIGKHDGQPGKGHRNKKVCYLCGETGHFRKDCPKNLYQRLPKPKHKGKSACLISEGESGSDTESDEKVFGVSSQPHNPNAWIVDSGASSHMTQRKELLVNYEEFDKPQKVSMGDGHMVEACGKGDIQFKMTLENDRPKTVTMRGTLYVPKLTCSLFSVRATVMKGNTVKFENGSCLIYDKNGILLGTGSLVDKLYYLKFESVAQESIAIATGSEVENKADLWHRRLGHLNEIQLREMASHDLVKGVNIPKSTRISFCEKCVEGKMSKKPFKSVREIRSVRKLQCVHSDVCGPMPTQSIGGNKYFVTFIDDYSRYCKVYFMKYKSEVFNKFKEFESTTTNEYGCSIGTLRTDNGGEYLSKEFDSYLQSKGINHELSAPYSPAQNGVAERFNRTLMESARTMMAQAELPECYWAEAVATAAYLRNRVPTRSLKSTTPYEKWFERKPDLSHIRVFGCMCYAYIPEVNKKGKLSNKAEKLRFIGYSLQTKGYRLIDESTSKVLVRRDVICNESDFQYDSSKTKVTNEGTTTNHEQVMVPEDEEPIELPIEPQPQEQVVQEQQHRYPRRQRTAPVRYGIDEFVDTAFLDEVQIEEPKGIEEALKDQEWKEAADSEYQSLMENETWKLVKLPTGRKPVGCKWIFKTKCTSDGKVERYKARLVAKGYTQKPGEDYDETFSPVVRYSSIRTLLAFAVQNGMMIHQMDVVTAFLNGTLDEDIYMEQPPGYIKKGEEHLVCKLKRSLYGLKQSSRCWNTVFKQYMESINFKQCTADPCIFVTGEEADLTIVAVYVDDLIVIAKTPETIKKIKESLAARFKMKDLGKLHYCLGISIQHDEERGSLWMDQRQYIQSLLKRYGLSQAKTATTPADINVKLVKNDGVSKPVNPLNYQSMVGSLLYAAITTRPDIAQAVGAVSKFNSCPTEAHLTAVKRIFRYLKGTIDLCIKYERSADNRLVGFSDADWAGDLTDRHSTTGNLFMMSGAAIDWISKKQPVVALSTTEAEYVALSAATQEAVWLSRLLTDIKAPPKEPILIKEDNQGTIAVARNPVSHNRTKHIDIKFHYVREALEDGIIDLTYCPTEQMTADMLTKPLARQQFETFRLKMGLKNMPSIKSI